MANLLRIALLATGNEITEGDILNTDGQLIAQILTANGFHIGLHVVAPDDDEDIKKALEFLLAEHQAVIMTGGLGPTSDDRTRNALSTVSERELEFDETSWQQICERVQKRLGREPHPSNRQQALFPKDATIIPNPNGTAAGCWLKHENKMIFMLPGPPKECLPMFETAVLPQLLQLKSPQKKIKYTWKLKDAVESEIAALIDEAVKNYPVQTGYRADSPYLEVKIYLSDESAKDELLEIIHKIISPYLVLEQKPL